METQKKNNNVLLVILIILVLGLGGFILYDRVLNNNEKCDNQDININNEENYNETIVKTYFEKYMNYIPFEYDNTYDYNRLKNQSIDDVKDKISMIVWRYIWENATDIEDRKMSETLIDSFLYEYFNLSNYELDELVLDDDDQLIPGEPIKVLGLTKEGDCYKATSAATEFLLPSYEVKSVTYNAENVIINFNTKPSYPSDDNIQSGTLTLKNNNGNLNFEKIEFNNL